MSAFSAVSETGTPPLPLTLLTGYLGSGKSTLLANLLLAPSLPYKLLIIDNEYGSNLAGNAAISSVGVEKMLIKDSSEITTTSSSADASQCEASQTFLTMPNGCVCCSLKSDLLLSLEELITNSATPYDRVIIETSGLTNVGALCATFWGDDAAIDIVRLDAVVCLVDAKNFHQCEDIHDARMQVMYADVLILNKLDIALSFEAALSIDAATKINILASVHRATKGRIEDVDEGEWINTILSINSYEPQQFCLPCLPPPSNRSGLAADSSTAAAASSSHGLTTQTIAVPARPLDISRVTRFLGLLLDDDVKTDKYGAGKMGIYRVKGNLRAGGEDAWEEERDAGGDVGEQYERSWVSKFVYSVNGVNDTYEIAKTDKKWADEGAEDASVVVFIGVSVERNELQIGLDGCAEDAMQDGHSDTDSDSDVGLDCLGFMFDALQATALKTFYFPSDVLVKLNAIDDTPGAVISGHYLWPASEILSRHIIASHASGALLTESPCRVLELGAGCGMCGIVASQLLDSNEGATASSVIFTDYDPGVLKRAEENVLETAEAVELHASLELSLQMKSFVNLAWGEADGVRGVVEEAGGRFDVLLGSDVIYSVDIVKPLFTTIAGLMEDRGVMVMSQSFVYDAATEAAMDQCCEEHGLVREVISNRLDAEDVEVKGKVQEFRRCNLVR